MKWHAYVKSGPMPAQFALCKRTVRKQFCRIIFLLLLLMGMNASAQTITLSLKDASIEKAFREIQAQSGYQFVYTNENVQLAKPVNLNLKEASIHTALSHLFERQPLTYSIEDHYVLVKAKIPEKPTVGKTDLAGVIRDERGMPIAGASVQVIGTNKATATNDKGEFILPQVEEDAVLLVSSVGYQTLQFPLHGEPYVEIRLRVSVSALDETVVIAYGTTTRRLNTGSISRITSEDIGKQPVANPLSTLQGRIPGIFITQNNGLPGGNFKVLIRGINSIQSGTEPLYIVDGVPYNSKNFNQLGGFLGTGNPLNYLSPSDIQSIEVLKDADATAIYGSRGANGVILITTKKAITGKSNLEMTFYSGAGKITRSMNYLNTGQYLKVRREAYSNDGVTPSISSGGADLVAWDTTRFIDWKKTLIGGTAHINNAQLQYSGGNQITSFTLSGSYFKESTVFPGDLGNSRGAFHSHLLHSSPDRKFRATLSTEYVLNKINLVQTDLTTYIELPPNAPKPYDSLGRLNWQENGSFFFNPLAILLKDYSVLTDNLIGNLQLQYNFSTHLTFKLSTGYNTVQSRETAVTPIASQNPVSNPKGAASFGTSQIKNWIIEPQTEYANTYGHIKIQALLGGTIQQQKNENYRISGSGYTNDNTLGSTTGAATISGAASNSLYRYEGIFSRLNFTSHEKLLINLTARRDGSSRFGPGKQFANFGAAGFGWIFSKEKWIHSSLPFLSFGKLRGSYGITGNDQINNYQFLDTWSATQYPYQNQPGFLPTRLFNPDYRWERIDKMEAALEFGLFKDRILATINWFNNKSRNQIISYSLPGQTGFTSILTNFPGVVQNTGWELELNSQNIQGKEFSWNTSLNITFSKNKLAEFPGLASSSYANSYRIGKPLNIYLGYHFLGVNPVSGLYKFEDINQDNTLNKFDYVYIGTTNPDFYGGLTNSFSYKRWSLDFLIQFVKQKGLDPVYSSSSVPGTQTNQPVEILNHWQKPGDATSYPKYTQGNSAVLSNLFDVTSSTAKLTDASYLRLKNLSLSYSLKNKRVKKSEMGNLSLFVQGQNLVTITKYKLDPESQNRISLPPLKMLTAGFRFTL